MRPTNCENGEHIPDAGYISPHRFFTLVFYEVTVSNQSSSALYVYHFKNHFSGFKLKNCYYIGTLIRQVLSQKLFYEIIKTRNFRCPKKKKKLETLVSLETENIIYLILENKLFGRLLNSVHICTYSNHIYNFFLEFFLYNIEILF